MKAVIIGNASAGGLQDEGRLHRYAKILREGGLSVEVWSTNHPRHATELAALAGERLIIAAGGDGTVNEVINGSPPQAIISIIPLGTANVLARELGLPLNPEEACHRIVHGNVDLIDLGVATDARGVERRFACMAGIGFDARVVEAVTPPVKARLRGGAFPLMAFAVYFKGRRFPQFALRTQKERYTARFAIVSNSHYYGGDYRITKENTLHSGRLHIALFERVGLLLRPDVLGRILLRRPLENYLTSFSARELEVAGPEGERVPVQLDGELWGELPVRLRVEPGALRVLR